MNSISGEYIAASYDIIEVAQKALNYYKRTGGFFDPRIIEILENAGYDKDFKKIEFRRKTPLKIQNNIFSRSLEDDLKIKKNKILFNRRMDFSGIAKGYITDKTAEFLKGKGFKNFLIDSGGDIYVAGLDEDNKSWKISIEGTSEEKLSFNLSDRGIATSGITRKKWESAEKKYHHLINPKNPINFLFDLKSVTVISEDVKKADIWAKTLFLMGRKKGIKYSNENKIASTFLDYIGNVYLSKEIKKYLLNKQNYE